jgi:hypothetical protein
MKRYLRFVSSGTNLLYFALSPRILTYERARIEGGQCYAAGMRRARCETKCSTEAPRTPKQPARPPKKTALNPVSLFGHKYKHILVIPLHEVFFAGKCFE